MTTEQTGREGGWMQTYTGRQFFPLDPRAEDIYIEDIAHALSQICRYGGHTDRIYTVAEHSVLLTRHFIGLGETDLARWALMHDSAEAYVGDMIRPIKQQMPGFAAVENRILAVIAERVGLPGSTIPAEVNEADARILLDERKAFLRKPAGRWDVDDLAPLGVTPIGWAPGVAKRIFRDTFRELFPKFDLVSW